MGNIVYDFADNSFNTEYVANSIIKILKEKYGREFEIVKIGERYGTEITNEVTVLCTVKNFHECIFRATYNMVDEKLVYDNFLIRCTCFFVEKEINKILRNVNSIVRVEIATKNALDNVYKTSKFLEKYKDEFFIATLIVEKHESNNFIEFLNELNSTYNNIKLKLLVYEMLPDEFSMFYEASKNMDYFPMSYVEDFKAKSKQIFKMENGIIESY